MQFYFRRSWSPSTAVFLFQLDLKAMETQEPDLEACRTLFSELEFTSMLRELAPSASAPVFELIDQATDEQAATFYAAARKNGFAFALAAAGTNGAGG